MSNKCRFSTIYLLAMTVTVKVQATVLPEKGGNGPIRFVTYLQ